MKFISTQMKIDRIIRDEEANYYGLVWQNLAANQKCPKLSEEGPEEEDE